MNDLIEQEKEKMNEEFKSSIKRLEKAEMERLDTLIEVAEKKEVAIKEKEEDIEDNKKKIVKNLLSMGMDILSIMKATGLTETEVLEIQQELN